MTVQQLITEHLDIWTAAHKTRSSAGRGSSSKLDLVGIKKLRELILELAVRGKLVPQDTNDEPASELLKKLRIEKTALIKKGEIKKGRGFPVIANEECFFDLPVGWEWARLEDVGRDWGQKSPDGSFTYIDVSAIDNTLGEIIEPTILFAEDAPSRARKIVAKGTVIYSTIRPYLQNIAVIGNDFSPEAIASTAFAILHPLLEMPAKYYSYYLRSPAFIRYVESVQTGIAYPAINDKQFYSGVVPIAPLAEQHRIVDKVDELMAFCDQLEQAQANNIAAHAQLVEALLVTLTNCTDHKQLQSNWQLLATHFDTLFTTEHSINQLKQTILQLAVMGKLVPQKTTDEPASELLKKIALEKAQLIKDGKIKKQKPLPDITEEEKPFELPEGWEFVRLQSIANVAAGNSFRSEDFSSEEGARVIKITNAGVGEFVETNDYLPFDFINTASQYLVSEGDFILALTRPYIADGLKISRCPASYHNSLLNQRVAAIKINQLMVIEYFYQFFKSYFVLGVYLNRFGGSGLQPNLKMSDVTELIFAVPPKEEQHRIVAKVEELMTLCDTLKTNLQNAQTTQLALAESLVEQAVN